MMKLKDNFKKILNNWLSWKKKNSIRRKKSPNKKCSKTENKDTKTSFQSTEKQSNLEFYKTKQTETNSPHSLDGTQQEILQVSSPLMNISKR